MKVKIYTLALVIVSVGLACTPYIDKTINTEDPRIVSYIVDPSQGNLKMHHKDKKGAVLYSFSNLKSYLEMEGNELVFAMNGGMFLKDFTPQGLYVQAGKTLSEIDTFSDKYGNFYMKPNGIFHLNTDNSASISTTATYESDSTIEYATQSGPMLVINGKLHPRFTQGSSNLHIRNGVGILPSGKVLFALSKEKINFYDFASFFKQQGCINALYLDGFVSRAYLPSENWVQMDGRFGVMIVEERKSKKP